jgi:membrane associated rhomboid family serine protease
MWFLWIFGDNVEDAFGHFGFLLFYLLCGIGAAAMQFIISIHSPVPMVGASGAISGVLGAYACFYPRARVVALVPVLFFLELIEIPAIIFITLWFLMQLMSGCMSIGINTSGGIAFWAHIGGFLYGWLIARSWKKFLSKRGMRIYSQDEDRVFTFKRRSGWW